ncbi:hypothetical protein GA0061098_104317 [Bradyrhizobium shewense]|uniref:Uncharacterized protein n=1 Tax=Bradyrhizobium shewense TaxID=1761772 RepID=A0A1C3XTZ8_9BRAD|nr:hypothetical protein GA0061098_104317 [Bradyrhizobium shewense]
MRRGTSKNSPWQTCRRMPLLVTRKLSASLTLVRCEKTSKAEQQLQKFCADARVRLFRPGQCCAGLHGSPVGLVPSARLLRSLLVNESCSFCGALALRQAHHCMGGLLKRGRSKARSRTPAMPRKTNAGPSSSRTPKRTGPKTSRLSTSCATTCRAFAPRIRWRFQCCAVWSLTPQSPSHGGRYRRVCTGTRCPNAPQGVLPRGIHYWSVQGAIDGNHL